MSEPLHFDLPLEEENIDETYVKSIIPELGVDNEYRTFGVRDVSLRVYYEDALVQIDIETGDGEREWLRKRILLAQMADLTKPPKVGGSSIPIFSELLCC